MFCNHFFIKGVYCDCDKQYCSKVWGKLFLRVLKPVSYELQGCIYLIKKTVIL